MNSKTDLKSLKATTKFSKPIITINNSSNDQNLNENSSSKNNQENESNFDSKSNANENSKKEVSVSNLTNKQDDLESFKPRQIESNSINKESWLLRLFESKLFNMSYAIIYLHQSKEIGVLNYIGNKMFNFDDSEVNFYLPQLIVLYINNNQIAESIRPYLLKRCKDDVKFTHNLLWLLNSFCFDSKNCHPLMKKKCNGLKLKSIILSEEFYYTKESFSSLNSYTNHLSQPRPSSSNTSSLSVNNKISELNCSKLLETDKLNNSNQYLMVKKTHHRSYSETTQIQISKLQNAQHSSNQSLNNILNPSLNHKIGDLNTGKAFDNNCLCLNTKNAVCDELKGEKFICKCGAPRLQAENEFIKCLLNIGKNLQNLIPSKQLRHQRLIADLQLLNFNLPARVYSPLHDHINHLVLRIAPFDAVLLNSKDKAPFLIYLEIYKLDGDINSTVLPNKANSLRLTRSEENLLNYQQANSRSTNCLLNVNSSCKLDSLDYSTQSEITVNASDIRKRLKNSIKPSGDNLEQICDSDDPSSFVLKEPWNEKVKRIRESSPFGHLRNWSLVGLIVKCDDLRQEMMTYQLLLTFKKIWQQEKVALFVHPYKIMVFSQEAGVLEPVLSTISLHQIKKITNNGSLLDYFIKEFGPITSEAFLTAQRNFVESCAAYSCIQYLIQLKDRHNNNILIDNDGHILHIDYQFIFSSSPRSLGFENSPFKMTNDIVEIMGGLQSDMFKYFKILILQGLLAARKHHQDLISIVEILQLPSFKNAIKPFKDRFCLNLTEQQLSNLVDQLVDHSINSYTTKIYDTFQYYSNNIL